MTTPMRERLAIALHERRRQHDIIPAVGWGELAEATREKVRVEIDAILAELETPDDEMIEVGRYSGPITGAKVLENAFTAMIRAVRGK